MAAAIRVGDKVHLRGWLGACEGILMLVTMASEVGTTQTVIGFGCGGGVSLSNGFHWPLSKLDKVEG